MLPILTCCFLGKINHFTFRTQFIAKPCALHLQVTVVVAASGHPTNQPKEEEVRILAIPRFALLYLSINAYFYFKGTQA
jgi:hypothetical protein